MSRNSSHRLGRLGAAVVALSATMAVAGCSPRSSKPLPPELQARWSRDSAAYVRDSITWARDASVRDSISRTVNTDTLYRLYHAMVVAQNPVPLFAHFQCASGALSWKHGSDPADNAIKRMEDTVWKRVDSAAVKRLMNRLGNMTVDEMMTQGVSPQKCNWGVRHDSHVNGTPLDFFDPAPVRPARPKS